MLMHKQHQEPETTPLYFLMKGKDDVRYHAQLLFKLMGHNTAKRCLKRYHQMPQLTYEHTTGIKDKVDDCY